MKMRNKDGTFRRQTEAEKIPTMVRFWAKVRKTETCWIWLSAKRQWGHGKFNIGGRWYGAHRLAYEECVGPIPPGKLVLHRCDNASCVRPDHLYVGTNFDNMRDASARKRLFLQNRGRARALKIIAAINRKAGTDTKIAKDFGVSSTLVRAIRTGVCWRFLTAGATAKDGEK